MIDAAPQPDAPAALAGLGQSCDPAMMGADCPMNASGCLTFTAGATTGICTAVCVANGTFMTDANAAAGPLMPDPATQDAMCPPIYTGTVGTAACNTLVNIMPAPPLVADTAYTFLAVCGITCGAGDTCPSGLTCNTQVMRCEP